MSTTNNSADLERERLFTSLMKNSGVNRGTLEQFIEAGVPIEDLESVVEMRNALTEYRSGPCDACPDGSIAAQVTVQAMIDAYQACEGDLDTLEEVVNVAEEILGRKLAQQDRTHSLVTDFNWALYAAVRRFKNDWEPEDDHNEDVWEGFRFTTKP